MSEIVFTVEEDPEGGYIARAVGQSIVTEADNLASLREMVRDAVQCHYDEGKAHRPSDCTSCGGSDKQRETARGRIRQGDGQGAIALRLLDHETDGKPRKARTKQGGVHHITIPNTIHPSWHSLHHHGRSRNSPRWIGMAWSSACFLIRQTS